MDSFSPSILPPEGISERSGFGPEDQIVAFKDQRSNNTLSTDRHETSGSLKKIVFKTRPSARSESPGPSGRLTVSSNTAAPANHNNPNSNNNNNNYGNNYTFAVNSRDSHHQSN